MRLDIRRFDIYRKVPKDLTQPTLTGAVISIACVAFIGFMLFEELYDYLSVDVFSAKFKINKVPGNFHLSTHGAEKQPENPDMRHTIDGLAFGEDSTGFEKHGTFNPLKGRSKLEGAEQASHEYVLKIVPSEYEDINEKRTFSYQYTYAHKEFLAMHPNGMMIPAIWFRYDLTPITVKYTEKRQPFYTFLTSVCAIVGGTFTVAGILDSLVFTAGEYWKKLEIGKQN